jgi:chromosome partitioning protein
MTSSLESNKPFVIAIANEKGGVGKTTTTLAIGTILAKRKYKVLFIDLDPQGNLTLSLGFKPHAMPLPSEGLPTAGTLFDKDSYATENENLDLVFARSLIIDDAHQVKGNIVDDTYYLSLDLSAVSTLPYDYVLIDCPPTLGKIMVNTLLVSDFLIVPTQADYFSAYALKDMMELIGRVRHEGNPDLLYRILITLFDKRNRIHHSIKNQLSYTFAAGIFQNLVEVDAEMRKTAILGFPTTSSRGVKQYRKIVDELLEYIQSIRLKQQQ